jgi:3-hydroxybutyryl-CoA dehydratase
MDFPGPGCIYLSQTLKFIKPVYLNDVVIVKVEINDVNIERSRLEFDTTCDVCNKTVLTGKAEIYIPKS